MIKFKPTNYGLAFNPTASFVKWLDTINTPRLEASIKNGQAFAKRGQELTVVKPKVKNRANF